MQYGGAGKEPHRTYLQISSLEAAFVFFEHIVVGLWYLSSIFAVLEKILMFEQYCAQYYTNMEQIKSLHMKSGGRHHAGFSFVGDFDLLMQCPKANWCTPCAVNTPTYIVLFAFLLPMPSGASKNLPKSDLRHFRTLYLSIVTAGSNPEVRLNIFILRSQTHLLVLSCDAGLKNDTSNRQ